MGIYSKLAGLKIIFERGRQYAVIVQFFLLVFLTIRELQRSNLSSFIPRTALAAPIGFLVALILLMVVGYVDYRLFYGSELEKASWKNPLTKRTFDELEVIKKKIDKIEQKL